MKLRDTIRRHRKDYRWIAGGLAGLLLVLTVIYGLLQRSRDLPSELVTNRVLLFVLWYINIVLILAFTFVLARNLFKLAVERRHRLLGSKFKTKLVLTYIGLSLIPVLLLFLYGTRLLQGWIDRWFDEPAIQRVAEQGYEVAREFNYQTHAVLLRDARNVLNDISSLGLRRARPSLEAALREQMEELDLAFISVYNGRDFVLGVLNPQSPIRDLPEPGDRFLIDTLNSGEEVRPRLLGEGLGRLLIAAIAVEGIPDQERPIVVAGTVISPAIDQGTAQLIQAYQGYRQLELQKDDIRAGFVLVFLMVTLLILLAVSWVGLYLARRVTEPIEALAEGTRRVASGELDFRVEAPADDELGILVDSFNRMTTDLQSSKALLEESNRELVDANQRLAQERAVISTVLQNTAAGVISVDQEGRVLTCNGAALHMLRQAGSDVVGKPVQEAWSDPDRSKLVELFEADAGSGGRIVRDVRMVLAGEWRIFEAKVTTMRHREGKIAGRVMVLEDLTELINAQQRAAWNEAARRIAHEIKNPLTPIKLAAERLRRKYRQDDPELGESLEEGVEIIVREVEAMQSMVDEFSRFARMPRPQPTEVDLGKLLRETIHLYEGIKDGVTIHSRVAEGATTAWLDAEQVKRALINLLDNAVDATEAPGDVRVSVDRGNGALQIQISDTGDGIPPEAKAKVFLPHFSTKQRGTGLGLSIVQRIVNEHHGTVKVEDNDPHGTVFTIDIPQG